MNNNVMDLHNKWLKNDPAYRKAYDDLADEFEVAGALIKARARANMTQMDVARSMKTSQSYVARLESGRIKPSMAALSRYAKATGSKLKVELT